jgi:hypothetical protein
LDKIIRENSNKIFDRNKVRIKIEKSARLMGILDTYNVLKAN